MVLRKRKTPAAKPRRPVGRPSKYLPKYCGMVIAHMRTGLSFESFAGLIGTTSPTLYSWQKKHPPFLSAATRAREECRLWWETAGRDGLFDTSETEIDDKGNRRTTTRRLNARVWDLNMKNRFGWRDKVDHNVEFTDKTPAEEAADVPSTSAA